MWYLSWTFNPFKIVVPLVPVFSWTVVLNDFKPMFPFYLFYNVHESMRTGKIDLKCLKYVKHIVSCWAAKGLAHSCKIFTQKIDSSPYSFFSYKVLFLDMPGDTIPASSSSYPLTNNNHFDTTTNPSVPRRTLTVTSRMASANQEENAKVNHDHWGQKERERGRERTRERERERLGVIIDFFYHVVLQYFKKKITWHCKMVC